MMYQNLSASGLWLLAFSVTVGYYVVMSAILYKWMYEWRPKGIAGRKIQKRDPSAKIVRQDRRAGYIATLIMSTMAFVSFWLIQHKYSQVSQNAPLEVVPIVCAVVASIALHDVYFYAVHRLFHTRWLFTHVHYVHHRNHSPTPWSTFAFHPVEAVTASLILPIVVLVIPQHPIAFIIFLVLQGLFNAFGHCGYDVLPGFWYRWRWWPFTSCQHHDRHHRSVTSNFSLYFSVLDKICGTERSDHLAQDPQMASHLSETLETQKSVGH